MAQARLIPVASPRASLRGRRTPGGALLQLCAVLWIASCDRLASYTGQSSSADLRGLDFAVDSRSRDMARDRPFANDVARDLAQPGCAVELDALTSAYSGTGTSHAWLHPASSKGSQFLLVAVGVNLPSVAQLRVFHGTFELDLHCSRPLATDRTIAIYRGEFLGSVPAATVSIQHATQPTFTLVGISSTWTNVRLGGSSRCVTTSGSAPLTTATVNDKPCLAVELVISQSTTLLPAPEAESLGGSSKLAPHLVGAAYRPPLLANTWTADTLTSWAAVSVFLYPK